MSVTQTMEQYQVILEEEVHDIAYLTGAVQRQGKLDAATFVQTTIFGFWEDPEIRLSGLAQINGRREVYVTETAISQRFTPKSANMFYRIMQRLAEVQLESEKVAIPLLKQFSTVIVEDSTSVRLPDKLVEIWLLSWIQKRSRESRCKGFCPMECINRKASWPSVNGWYNQRS